MGTLARQPTSRSNCCSHPGRMRSGGKCVWNVDRVLMKQTFRQVSMYEVKFVQCVMGTAYCVYYMCRTHDKFSVVFLLLSDGLNNLLDDATVCRHHVSIILSFLALASTSLLHLCCVY